MDRGAWWAVVSGVTGSHTRLKRLSTGTHKMTETDERSKEQNMAESRIADVKISVLSQ